MPSLCCKSKGHDNFASSTATNQYAPNTVIEPVHLDISLKFGNLKEETMHGKVTLTFCHSGRALIGKDERSTVVLNAEQFEDLQVLGEGVTHTYDGHHIQLFWSTPFEQSSRREVTITYKVEEPIAGLYFQKADSMIGASPLWAITDHETEKARYWLPTVDFPAVRTTLTWAITAPEEYTSLANGSFVSQETKDGLTTTCWELKHLCPSYLICFAVGEFVSVDDGEVDGRPIKYFAAKGYEPADLKRAFDKTPAMMQWLQNKIGVSFPWPKYYQIALPAVGGAMENISLVTWCDTFIQDETNSLERKYLTDLVNIHEMGHTYFGDLLVIRHFEHAWLKESWASYIESCWLEDNVSVDHFRHEMLENAHSYFSECQRYMRPIVTRKYDSSWDLFDMHTYPGGAWRIHMLRKRLGDEAFWCGVNQYVKEFSGKTVQTTDFQTCLERASGLNLTRFFDEWVYSKGYPKIKAQYEYSKTDNRVKFVLTQTQVDEANNIPLFATDIEIEFTDDQNHVYTTRVTFDRDASVTTFINLNDKASPQSLRIDPDGKVLFSLELAADQDILINMAKNASDVVSRITAYTELIKKGSRPLLKTIREAIQIEPFYGVRVAAANELAKLNSTLSLQILAEMLDNEKDPMAMASIADACKIRDDLMRSAILRFLERPSLPYRAHGAALMALGYQRNPEDLEYLLRVAQDDGAIGQHGIVRSGALKALGYHRSQEAFNYLNNRVGSEIGLEPMRARPQGIRALQHSAEWQEDRLKKLAVESIAQSIRSPHPIVRMHAVGALASLKATSVCNAIASTRHMYPHDDHSWLNRQLKRLQDSSPVSEGLRADKDKIEKLEDRVKKLEEQLADWMKK
ncbi:peptidase family M1-domain-containing protein [Radiomyces spectabilis]|uniref:peptidase family M1-domain-containing protein n=1 Tax=Radiomyces spectabilis TaxID=64574 RepID=UPI00221F3AB6|nr:peptidase family M1-domain-containing protein [Radiomyces spectabilis]KAI8391176.1 peptidase family M1-domain-containing protein [Radiomyces spectabilis]